MSETIGVLLCTAPFWVMLVWGLSYVLRGKGGGDPPEGYGSQGDFS